MEAEGPDWYCNYCDKMVPHVDSKNGRHDETKRGCGNPLLVCKIDVSALPKERCEMTKVIKVKAWLMLDVSEAKPRLCYADEVGSILHRAGVIAAFFKKVARPKQFQKEKIVVPCEITYSI